MGLAFCPKSGWGSASDWLQRGLEKKGNSEGVVTFTFTDGLEPTYYTQALLFPVPFREESPCKL